MSDISIRRPHALSIEEARASAERIAERLKKDFDLEYAWQRHVLHFERPGVKGELHVTQSEVRLEAKLGLLFGFLKSRVEREVDAQFDKYFGAPAPKRAPEKKAADKKAAPRKAPAKKA